MNYINVLDVVDPGRFPKTTPDSDITLYIVIGAFLLVLIVGVVVLLRKKAKK